MYSSTHSLTSALGGGQWSASRPGSFVTTGINELSGEVS
jgi:hypothetical protein